MKFKCLIVDDEPIAQEIIKKYIEPLEQLEVAGSCKNTIEANNLLHELSIDLMFLDIEMPQIDGLSFLKHLKNPPLVIVTTAYREYALEGYELEVVDYLLKPISQERFLKAINRVLSKPETGRNPIPYIYLKVDMKMVQVFLEDILYIQGLSNYVRIYCKEKNFVSYQKLSHLEEVLPTGQFVRSHRSYIVNIQKITSFTNNDVEIGKIELPIGGNYRDKLMSILSRYQA